MILKLNFKGASELLPKKIEQTFEQPKVREMILAIGLISVKRMIQFELIKLAELMSVGGNLNSAQVDFIADELIEKYPNESIADFKICFRKGAIGAYGDIQRMDGITIAKWMKEYLIEKYTILENQLINERDEYWKPVVPENSDRDWHTEWLTAVNKSDGFKQVPHLDEDEIKKEGQVRPAKKVYPYNESEAQIRLREHHDKIFQFQEMTIRERHPEYSEEEIKSELERMKATILYEESKPKHTFGIAKIWEAKKKKKTA